MFLQTLESEQAPLLSPDYHPSEGQMCTYLGFHTQPKNMCPSLALDNNRQLDHLDKLCMGWLSSWLAITTAEDTQGCFILQGWRLIRLPAAVTGLEKDPQRGQGYWNQSLKINKIIPAVKSLSGN